MVNDDLEQRRSTRLRAYAIAQALARLETERPGFTPEAIVASVCAYEEEATSPTSREDAGLGQRRALHDGRGRRRGDDRTRRSRGPFRASW